MRSDNLSIPTTTLASIGFPAIPGNLDSAILAINFQMEQSQWWPQDRVLRAQLGQLEVLLAHAATASPFYRLRLSGVTGLKRGLLTMDRFRSIPVLSRSQLQEAGNDLISKTLPKGHQAGQDITTSGSTGRPVTVKCTNVTSLFLSALNLRFHLWSGRDFHGTATSITKLRGIEEKHYRQRRPVAPWSPCFRTGPMHLCDVSQPVHEQFDWLIGLNPSILKTYPSNLMDLLRLSENTGVRPANLVDVSTMGEVVEPDLRAACQRIWGATISDCYSCQEAGVLAIQCPDHPHYHVQSESVLVEVLDESGEPCRAGDTGRVVVTDLHNFAMPLIRYEIGDYAEVGEPCACGRILPVLSRVLGRVRNMLTLPDGGRTWPLTGLAEYDKVVPVRQCQMVQKTPHDIEVRLVAPRPVARDEEDRLREITVRSLGHSFNITFTYPDRIPRDSSGKFEDFRSEIP